MFSFRHCKFLLLLLVSVSTSAVAQSPPSKLLPAELFFGNPTLQEAVLSPSGKRLAFTTGKDNTRVGLFVSDLTPGGKVTRAAQASNADVGGIQWVNDDRLLYRTYDSTEGSGRQEHSAGLFAVNYDGSDERELFARKYHFVVSAKERVLPLASFSHRLLLVPDQESGQPNDKVLVGSYTEGSGDDLPTVQPLWQNVYTGKTTNTDFQQPKRTVEFMFDRKGRPRIASTQVGKTLTNYWRGPGDAEWKKIVEGDLLSMPFEPQSVDDTGNLYVTRNQGPAGYAVLSKFDFEKMAPGTTPMISTPGFDFEGSLIYERGNDKALGVRVTTDAESTEWFDEGMKAIQAAVDKRFPDRINRISCRNCLQSGAVVLVRSFSDRDPGRLWLYRPTPAEGQVAWKAISSVRDGVDPRTMADMDFQRIKARDGQDLPIWITKPRGVVPGKPAPAVVMVHGGPFVRGHEWRWESTAQFLASRGYLVIEPEFRGSKGYGDAHFKAGWKKWGQSMQDDVADALLWAQQQKLATEKACVAGASYGGYATFMGLIRHPELFQCGVAWVAVSDLELLVKGSAWVDTDIGDLSRKHTIPYMIGDPKTDADMLAKNSPVRLADQIKAPMLMAFGESDVRVPLAHGERMRSAMMKNKQDPEYVVYVDEGHGWAKMENRLDWANRMERFLGKYLPVNPR